MRLGLWNRLAIVATVLAFLFAPLAIMTDIAADQAEARELRVANCQSFAESKLKRDIAAGRHPTYPEDSTACYSSVWDTPSYAWNWKAWREFAGGTLAFCAILYGLMWLIVWVAKWVWRGRRPNP